MSRRINKTIFVTFGWTESPAISSILRHGLSGGDRITLITLERRDERSEAALRDLKAFITNYARDIEISELRVNVDDPVTSIFKLKRALEEEKGRKCIVNLSGGMRAIVLFTYIASLLTEHPDVTVELETEDKRAVIEVPKLKLTDLIEVEKLSHLSREIMKELLVGPLKATELREKLKAVPSTFHYAQEELLKRGYIVRERKDKTYILRLTPRGKLLAKLLEG